MLLYRAEVLETIERADEFGIEASVDSIAFSDIVQEVNEDVHEDSESVRRGLESSSDHDLYRTEGRFVNERTVEVASGERVYADTVLVAAGTRPGTPSVDGIEDVDYMTSTEALQRDEPPDHLVVIGGGYIAAELGHFFGTFGSDVSIIGRRPHLLPDADEEVAAEFTERLADRLDVYTGYEATAVSESNGTVTVEARPYPEPESQPYPEPESGEGAAERVTVTGDELLVATGRVPNTDTLNVSVAGIETDEQGFVETDEYLRTTADGVWALGDVVGEYLLKHNANHEAQTVARNLFVNELEPIDYTAIPFAVFSSPEVAGVGATEAELRAADRDYAKRTYRYEDTARGNAMKAEGFVKPLIDLEGEILGCHIVGPGASNLIEEAVLAMKAGSGTVRDIRESVHVHPALSEVVQRAFSGQFTRSGHDHDHRHNH